MSSQRIVLMENESTTSSAKVWNGGLGTFHVVGSLGGATVILQRLGPDGATWSNVGPNTTLTAAGMANFEIGASTIRVSVSGGAPSNLYAEVSGAN